MKKILLATNNQHKVNEIKHIIAQLNSEIEIITPSDFKDFTSPDENGDSYKENAYIKAKYYFDKYHIDTIADDSGIEIEFYNNGPGIYSSRFKMGLSSDDRNNEILEEMKDCDNRKARFNCYIAFVSQNGVQYFEGIVKGKISYETMGKEGFGYDPIFIPDGQDKSNALLGEDYKNHFGHRAIAIREWVNSLEK